MDDTVTRDLNILTTGLMPVIADQYASKTTDEAARKRIARGLAIAQQGRLGKAEQYSGTDRVWDVPSQDGSKIYTVWNGECTCESAKRASLCKHRYAIGITVEAQRLAQERAQQARYAILNGESGVVWPVSDTDLMFMSLDPPTVGRTTYLDPESAFGESSTLDIFSKMLRD